MKHKMKKYSRWVASCSHMGCICSLEGPNVGNLSQKEIGDMFDGICPVTYKSSKTEHFVTIAGKEAIKQIIKNANKTIKRCERIIKFWSKYL